MSSSCLGRAAVPVKRVWRGITARLRLRRTTGLGRLRKEVRTCEYSDIHVMWEMLSNTNTTTSSRGRVRGGGGSMAAAAADDDTAGKATRMGKKKKKATVAWSRLATYCCAL